MNRRHIFCFFVSLLMILAFSCKSKKEVVKREFPKAKREEVKPTPVTPKAPVSKKQKIGIPLNSKDNRMLYAEIEKWLGTPHVTGGCSLNGIDCSCFVLTIYRDVYGLDLYRSSVDMMRNTVSVKRDELKEGDILFFKVDNAKGINHVGIYLKEDYFAHTSSSRGVMISKLTEDYWSKYFFAGGRHKDVKTNY